MPWDPMRDLLTMQERLESLFGRTSPGWLPPAELSEVDDKYVLTVELAGLRREDVRIDFRDDVLTVHGQRPSDGCCPDRYQQLERGQGAFSRSFHFGRPITATAIVADLTEGVLTVTVPKAAPGSRLIDVE